MKHNKYKSRILFFPAFFALLTSSFSFGEQKTFSSKELQSIVIKAVHLNLKIKESNTSFYTVKWTGKLSVQNREKSLFVQSDDFNSKKSWKTGTLKTKASLEISGPSLPVRLFAFSSASSFSHWKKPVFISSFKGELKATKTRGPWEISFKKGSVRLHQHQGSLSVQGFHINQILSSSQGSFRFYINEGSLKVKKSKGDLDFTTDKAEIRLTQFKGNLKGFSQSGTVRAVVQPEKMELSSEKSPLHVSFMGQGPKITAYTEKGKIYGARHLHKQFSGKSTQVSGRMRGSVKKGDSLLKIGNRFYLYQLNH